MKAKLFQHKLLVKKSRIHGYGVFAQKNIRKGELIEECYCLIFDAKQTCLDEFAFASGKKAMVLTGYGCLYNHADTNNALHEFDEKNRIMRFKALSSIKKGEEIFVNYGKDWFTSRNWHAK